MLVETLERLNKEFPTVVPFVSPSLSYDKKEKKLMLSVWINNIQNNFFIEESELEDIDKLIYDIKDLHTRG